MSEINLIIHDYKRLALPLFRTCVICGNFGSTIAEHKKDGTFICKSCAKKLAYTDALSFLPTVTKTRTCDRCMKKGDEVYLVEGRPNCRSCAADYIAVKMKNDYSIY